MDRIEILNKLLTPEYETKRWAVEGSVEICNIYKEDSYICIGFVCYYPNHATFTTTVGMKSRKIIISYANPNYQNIAKMALNSVYQTRVIK